MPDFIMKKELGDTKDVLQDVVVVVSLITTLAKSFGSAGHLYRKLKRKAKNTKKGLKEDIKHELDDHSSEDERSHHRFSHFEEDEKGHRWRHRSRSRHRCDDSRDSDKESIEHSYDLVRAEYERGFHHIGEKYAVGDCKSSKLDFRKRIITLQQKLLYTYEDVILNPNSSHHSPSYHLGEIMAITRAARSASIDALAMQYQRMLPATEPPKIIISPPSLPDAPTSPTRRRSHDIVLHSRQKDFIEHGVGHHEHFHSPSRGASNSKSVAPDLYCLYARNLQRNGTLPLTDTFKAGGDGCCPYCHTHIASRSNKAWEIVKDDELLAGSSRTFLVGARFVIKCHRQGGGFACALCSKHRDADTVCGEIGALVDHLWKEHTCAELALDEDTREGS